jgi:rod shape-determining protein MreC
VLLVGSRSDSARGEALRGVALNITAPSWSWGQAPAAAVGGWSDAIADHFDTVDHNRRLEHRLRQMRHLVEERDGLARQNRQLKALLGVMEPQASWSRVVAIAGASSGSYVRSAVVAGGRRDGLRSGQPVRNVDGLVGRVTEVGSSAARVLLIIDAASRIPVRVVRTGKPAMVAGINGALVEVRYAAPIDGPLRPGDRLVTSGDGGVFPPDLPVATVEGFDGEIPMARPAARLDGLGYVIVQAPWLPPVPAPAPASEPGR